MAYEYSDDSRFFDILRNAVIASLEIELTEQIDFLDDVKIDYGHWKAGETTVDYAEDLKNGEEIIRSLKVILALLNNKPHPK